MTTFGESAVPRRAIRIACEGSDNVAHSLKMNGGICAMCGVIVACRDDGTAWPHERNDILAMLERGDFAEDIEVDADA